MVDGDAIRDAAGSRRDGKTDLAGAIAALKRAKYAALLKRRCGWVPSRRWSCEAPPEGEVARFGGFDEGEAFGNRIVVAAD